MRSSTGRVPRPVRRSKYFGRTSDATRAKLLRAIADRIEANDEIIARGQLETGLATRRGSKANGPAPAANCDCSRRSLEDGSWVGARIDHAQPDRQPLAKPDVRSMRRPLGPVAVFCASNFPLAFSVAGGDTASALAAGCPVIVKAHHAHPGVAELVADAVVAAVAACDLPPGVFSLLYGAGRTVGQALVSHPCVKAVGFTGSRSGGQALMQDRRGTHEPIPVYAEMSSVNPMFLLPGALRERTRADCPRAARLGDAGRRPVLHESRARVRPGRRGVGRVSRKAHRVDARHARRARCCITASASRTPPASAAM